MRALGVTIDEGPMPFDLRYEFSDRTTGTVIDVLIESHSRGARRLAETVFGPLIRRQVAGHYRTSKRVLEESVGAG